MTEEEAFQIIDVVVPAVVRRCRQIIAEEFAILRAGVYHPSSPASTSGDDNRIAELETKLAEAEAETIRLKDLLQKQAIGVSAIGSASASAASPTTSTGTREDKIEELILVTCTKTPKVRQLAQQWAQQGINDAEVAKRVAVAIADGTLKQRKK